MSYGDFLAQDRAYQRGSSAAIVSEAIHAEEKKANEALTAEVAAKKTVFIVYDNASIEGVFSMYEKADEFRIKAAEPFWIEEFEIDGGRID